MNRARWLGVLWLSGSLLSACGKSDASLPGAAAGARPRAIQGGPVAPPLYDAQGHLLGSGIRVGWIEVPRGFTPRPAGASAEVVYEAHGILPARVRDFLAPQMLTGSAEQVGEGVIYRGVMPHDGTPDAMRFDVSVLEVAPKGSLFLTITPASFPNIKAISEPEARKLLANETKNAE